MTTTHLPFVKEYGNVVIDVAYEIPAVGYIWLINREKGVGFARLQEPEWGPISEKEILLSAKTNPVFTRPRRIFKTHLPCTFRDVVLERAPQVQSYFVSQY